MKFHLKNLCALALAAIAPVTLSAREVAHFTMENSGDKISETISNSSFQISGVHSAENVAGARGNALRFDGYSTYIDAKIGNIIPQDSKKMTASIWFAVETYPIVELDVNTPRQVAIASCIDESAKTGFGFFIGFDGKYSFKTYVGGWPLELKVDKPLEQYKWINLTAVLDGEAKTATLYNNGVSVATSKANGTFTAANSTMRIGRSADVLSFGPFCTTSFNGIIDDITVWDEALGSDVIAGWTAENDVDMSIPDSRFAGNLLRPAFHGMPGANWTNETHGMTYYNGRYHIFFQKNANGPYMARLHWGHLSSENLYDWKEEKIALTPGEPFDIKGCWSGCVFTDDELTGGKPSILYTGVDYVKAVIAQATPDDDNLIGWTKGSAPIINGRPSGLSDDFRDPYFFRTDHGAYILVGSSKDGRGTTTLHAYNPVTKRWSNDGRTFFSAADASQGSFWEMPNVTRMADGRWLFTATPLKTSQGVRTLYWVGTISADGTFIPESGPKTVEMSSRDGFGLLSPTVYNHDGKTIALGIVPDKLPGDYNYRLGWAHCYSLPREWSLDADGNLVQKPFSGLVGMRSGNEWSYTGQVSGDMKIESLADNRYEILASFKVGDAPFGFKLFDNGSASAILYYNPASGELVADFSQVERWTNDRGVYDGVYRMPLPKRPAAGESLKINLFVDGSIIDIFVNDTWAQSIRVFPQNEAALGVSVYADKPVNADYIRAWNLKPSAAGVDGILADNGITESETVDVWHISGSLVRAGVAKNAATENLDSGIYIIGGKKILVK